MKKLGLLVMPLMAISLLMSCGNKSTTYTLTFDCTNCKVLDENKKEITSVEIPLLSPYTTYHKFYLDGKGLYKKPLESLIKVEKTNKNEEVDFEYNPLTGEMLIPVIGNLTITASGINKTLEECTWPEINEISTTGRAEEFFYVGEEKKVYLFNIDESTNTRTKQDFAHTVRIIGFNHDYSKLPDEGDPDPSEALGITFEFENAITKGTTDAGDAYETIWDGEFSGSGDNYDYRKTVLNNFLNTNVLNMLPSSGDPDNPDLKEVIKPVDKKVGVNESETEGEDNYTATSFDGSDDYPYPYLFALAHNEMADNDDLGVTEDEGFEYQYYIEHPNQEDRIKRRVGIESGDGEFYWLRSPCTDGSDYAWLVNVDGHLDKYGYVYNHVDAVAPAFCI